MWAKLLQAVLIPWIEKSVVALFKWAVNSFRDWRRKKKLKKENDGKVEAYENADNIDDAADSYSELP